MADYDPAELALRNARRAASVAVFCLVVMLVMFLIDAQRNRVMLGAVTEARRILDEFKVVASGAAASAPVGGTGPVADDPGGDTGGGVEPAPPAGAGVDQASPNGTVEVSGTPGSRAGMAGGPRGNV